LLLEGKAKKTNDFFMQQFNFLKTDVLFQIKKELFELFELKTYLLSYKSFYLKKKKIESIKQRLNEILNFIKKINNNENNNNNNNNKNENLFSIKLKFQENSFETKKLVEILKFKTENIVKSIEKIEKVFIFNFN
jgi:hypothetical protein